MFIFHLLLFSFLQETAQRQKKTNKQTGLEKCLLPKWLPTNSIIYKLLSSPTCSFHLIFQDTEQGPEWQDCDEFVAGVAASQHFVHYCC